VVDVDPKNFQVLAEKGGSIGIREWESWEPGCSFACI
jgi:hypothetical protein